MFHDVPARPDYAALETAALRLRRHSPHRTHYTLHDRMIER
jgi:hypothetical protein